MNGIATQSPRGEGEGNEIKKETPSPLGGRAWVRVIMRFFHTFRGQGGFSWIAGGQERMATMRALIETPFNF
jgi:hypothetical protein